MLDGLTNELLHGLYLLGQAFHVVAYLFGGNLRINLRAADAGVAHHLRQGFNRHAVGEADGGGIRVAALVPGDVLVDAAKFGHRLDAVLAVPITWDGQQPSVFCHTSVLLDDVPWYVEQADIRLHAGLLAVGLYPQMAVERGLQVLLRQVVHIPPAQSREAAEDEEVPDKFIAFLLESPVDECRNLLLGQEAALGLFLRDVVGIEGVTCQPAVVDGGEYDAAEGHHIRPHGVGAVVLLSAEEQLEVGDEGGCQLTQGDVAHLVALPDELRQVVIYHAVFPVAALAFHLAYLLRIVLVVLLEHGKQGLVVLPQAQVGVADLLRRDIAVGVAHLLISLVDAEPYLVQHTVALLCHEAAACQLAQFHVPHFLLHVQLAAEL